LFGEANAPAASFFEYKRRSDFFNHESVSGATWVLALKVQLSAVRALNLEKSALFSADFSKIIGARAENSTFSGRTADSFGRSLIVRAASAESSTFSGARAES
jgi:hypothetical protein